MPGDGSVQPDDAGTDGRPVAETDQYEYPFRVTDWHGEVVAEGLDNVPPLLNQEEIDRLARHLSDTVITEQAVADAALKLPDSQGGKGSADPTLTLGCHKCDGVIEGTADDEIVVAFGNFYHTECVEPPNLQDTETGRSGRAE